MKDRITNFCSNEICWIYNKYCDKDCKHRKQQYFSQTTIPTLALFAIVLLTSCKTQYILPTDSVTNSTEYISRIERDSIYIHDSIFVDRWHNGDTIFQYKTITHWKDRFLTKHDTLTTHDTTTIYTPVEVPVITNEVPKFYRGSTIALWVLIAIFLIYLVYRILKAVYLRK